MNFWGYLFIAITVLSFIVGMRTIVQGAKAVTPETRPGVLFLGLLLAALVIGVIHGLPFLLAVEYPLNWAAWAIIAWFLYSFLYATYGAIAGRPARPARSGWGSAWRIGRLVVVHGGIVVLFLFACGVL